MCSSPELQSSPHVPAAYAPDTDLSRLHGSLDGERPLGAGGASMRARPNAGGGDPLQAGRARLPYRVCAIGATLVSPRSAELLYVPSERSIEIVMRFGEFVILFGIWSASYFREPKWIDIEHPQ